ncbi:MAG: hypothetical protein R3D44_13775 [Hyphomicrobiaceae bacterium]
MNRIILPALAALAFGASASVAAAQTTTDQKAASPSTGSQTGSAMQTPAGTANIHAMSQSKLTDALKKAGFQDVSIVDASYMVHAKTSDGEPVVMVINPPSVSSATGGGSGTSGRSSAGESLASPPGATDSTGAGSGTTTSPATK